MSDRTKRLNEAEYEEAAPRIRKRPVPDWAHVIRAKSGFVVETFAGPRGVVVRARGRTPEDAFSNLQEMLLKADLVKEMWA